MEVIDDYDLSDSQREHVKDVLRNRTKLSEDVINENFRCIRFHEINEKLHIIFYKEDTVTTIGDGNITKKDHLHFNDGAIKLEMKDKDTGILHIIAELLAFKGEEIPYFFTRYTGPYATDNSNSETKL